MLRCWSGWGTLATILMAASSAHAQCFAPAVNYAAGSGPTSVAVGDFNADGRLDLAVANYGNNVAILLGNVGGTFQAAVNYGVGNVPVSLAVGDFNADGRPDLAVVNQDSNNVSILLGNANGTFQGAVNYGVGSYPSSVAVGDFNADGKPDLAVVNADNNVAILLGNVGGGGTFQRAVYYASGYGSFSVAVGDFNGDGRPDLAVVNTLGNNVSILLGNVGAGSTFQGAVYYAAGVYPNFVGVGDFNGDGRPDLAVTYNGGLSSGVTILLGNSDGTFQGNVAYYVGNDYASSVAVGDFNADGWPDVAVANDYDNVSILLGNANGTFQEASIYAVGPNPHSVAVGDFNADGRPDLVTANLGSSNVSVVLSTGTGSRPAITQQPAPVSVCPSGTATFSITASGTTPAYQWQWQPVGTGVLWAALSDGINDDGTTAFDVSGATTPTVNIRSIRGLGGNFRCIVTNACGSVNSDEATLTICPADFNCDGALDFFDYDDFVAAFEAGQPSADFNKDTAVDFFDYDDFVVAFEAGC